MSEIHSSQVKTIPFAQELLRKSVHLSSLWMPIAIFLLPKYPMVIIFAIFLVINLISEHAYSSHWPILGSLYGKLFGKMLRSEPQPGSWVISGGPYVLASALLVTLIYPRASAVCGMATMLLADTAAALIGRRFGKHPTVNHKSIEGVVAFQITGFLVIAAGFFLFDFTWVQTAAGVVGVILASMAELFEKQLKLDDNFSIPLIVGLLLLIA